MYFYFNHLGVFVVKPLCIVYSHATCSSLCNELHIDRHDFRTLRKLTLVPAGLHFTSILPNMERMSLSVCVVGLISHSFTIALHLWRYLQYNCWLIVPVKTSNWKFKGEKNIGGLSKRAFSRCRIYPRKHRYRICTGLSRMFSRATTCYVTIETAHWCISYYPRFY